MEYFFFWWNIFSTVKFIECKVINGRKIGIKVTLEVAMKVYSKEPVEIITDLTTETTTKTTDLVENAHLMKKELRKTSKT